MNLNVPSELTGFIDSYPSFLICGHMEPDGDCIGSQLALGSLLRRLGKKAECISPGPFSRPEIREYAHLFSDRVTEDAEENNTGVIITDCSTMERTGHLQEQLAAFSLAVIDHHSAGEQFGGASWIIPESPSTTVLVYSLYRHYGMTPSADEAWHLLFGLATDTGFFRHLGGSSSEAFRITAELIDCGVSPNDIYMKIFGCRTLESRLLLGKLLDRTSFFYNKKLLLTYQTLEDNETFGKVDKDSDMLYMLLQGVREAEAVIFVKEEKEGECTVGLRSNNDVDVGKVAYDNNGGGHKKAAGFTYYGNRQDITEKLIDSFSFLD